MLTRILAAGLSSEMDLRMVAPSLVTVMLWFEADSKSSAVEFLQVMSVLTKNLVHSLWNISTTPGGGK